MRWRVVSAVVLAMGLLPAAARAQAVDERPAVQIGFLTVANGRQTAGGNYSAVRESGGVLKGTAFWAACSAGIAPQTPAQALYAWSVDGRVVSMTADEATVDFTWRRVLADAAPATSPGGIVRRTLRIGESVTLDSVDRAQACRGGTVSLMYVVRLVGFQRVQSGSSPVTGYLWDKNRRPLVNTIVRMRQTAGGAGEMYVRTNEKGEFRFEGLGGSYVLEHVGGPAGSGATQLSAADEMSFMLETVKQLQSLAEGQVAGYTVDLWLVRSVPDRQDEVTHQVVSAGALAAAFQFAPVRISTPQGEVRVVIQGSVAAIDTTRGKEFEFVADRRVEFALLVPAGQQRPVDSRGGTRITQALPEPDEVLSFQMPAIRIAGGPAIADRFSIRMRMTPRAQ